jgi:16S rRNA processing protein RimM
VRGELRVVPHHPGDPLPDEVERVRVTLRSGEAREYALAKARPTEGAWLVTLEAIHDRDQAEALKGAAFEVPASELPEPDEGEMYAYEMVGATVEDEAGATLGTVQGFMENAAQDVLVIASPQGEKLLPYVEETIVRWDEARRVLVVRPVPGLWD